MVFWWTLPTPRLLDRLSSQARALRFKVHFRLDFWVIWSNYFIKTKWNGKANASSAKHQIPTTKNSSCLNSTLVELLVKHFFLIWQFISIKNHKNWEKLSSPHSFTNFQSGSRIFINVLTIPIAFTKNVTANKQTGLNLGG